MFEPQHKSKWYLLLILGVAALVGWSAYKQYKPFVIQTSCSEIAARSSGILHSNMQNLDPTYSYDNVRSRCIKESEN